MRLRLIVGGKLREQELRASTDDYLKRLRRYLPVEEVEVPQGRGAKALRAFERAIPDRYERWALDAGGDQPTSEELARWIEARMMRGTQGLALLIGGADGLPSRLVKAADERLSLSRLTFPHRLARLLLVEQLYRAMTIIKGEGYHK